MSYVNGNDEMQYKMQPQRLGVWGKIWEDYSPLKWIGRKVKKVRVVRSRYLYRCAINAYKCPVYTVEIVWLRTITVRRQSEISLFTKLINLLINWNTNSAVMIYWKWRGTMAYSTKVCIAWIQNWSFIIYCCRMAGFGAPYIFLLAAWCDIWTFSPTTKMKHFP